MSMTPLYQIRIDYPAAKTAKTQFCREYGLNAYYSGKHWTQRNADACYWHSLIRACVRRQGINIELTEERLAVIVSFDDGLDIDNHAVMLKFIIDGLKGYAFPEDSRKYIGYVGMGFNDQNCILISVCKMD